MSTPLPTTSTPQTAPTVRLVATPEQQRVLDRIELQRERLRARRVARAQARALAEQAGGATVMAGVALVAGPRRLIRWAGIVLPMLMRLRR